MKDLENINESFASAGKELPFKVPQGYFESLPNRIQERCLLEKTPVSNVNYSFFRVFKGQLAFAAGFIGLAMMAYTGYYFIHPKSDYSKKTGEDYIEIVQKSIYENYQDLPAKSSRSLLNYDSLKNNHREEVVKYLFEEDIDYVTLMERY
jgi:hypothetical protein